jgi:ubiquinone/menaquinone biosynthesis C-methylase UbiE
MDIGCGMGYFTLGLADLVGESGQVFGVDLQEEMLAGLRRRAQRRGLLARIRTQRAMPRQIGLDVELDFVLAFWMVHEVADRRTFLSEIEELLSPEAGSKLLVVEPLIHVSAADFLHTVSLAQELGFEPAAWPKIALSRAVVLARRE